MEPPSLGSRLFLIYPFLHTGIISSIAFCPDQTNEYFAAGTLTPSNFNIALFTESTGEKTIMWVGCEGLRNSVSQVNSSLSSARKPADLSQCLSLNSTLPTHQSSTRPSAGAQGFTAGIFEETLRLPSKSFKLPTSTIERLRTKSSFLTSIMQEDGLE